MGDDLCEVFGMANFSSLSNVNFSLLLGRLDGTKGAAKGGLVAAVVVGNGFVYMRVCV